MMNSLIQSVRSVIKSRPIASISVILLTIILSSCSSNYTVQSESQRNGITHYTIVCIIHGDGDYLYHDTNGNEYTADEKVLSDIKKVALQNPNAEVFIFHQRPAQSFLFFFPLRDGEFYYYRNGQLLENELYWRDQEQTHLIPEAKLYHQFKNNDQQEMISMFLYFGHEIPEFNGDGYDDSYPDRTFTVHDLYSGVKNIKTDSSKFDLMILSTCYGGTPYTISSLGRFAKTIVASPDNLHLSYFDLNSLERLDINLKNGNVPAFAKQFSQQNFERLSGDIQTAVSIAVYDVDRVQKYLNSVHYKYEQALTNLKSKTNVSPPVIEHCDCADLPEYVQPSMSDGVTLFYRPANFGRLKNKLTHSGWECWKN